MSSPQSSSLFDERINSLINQLESFPKPNSSLEQIFHRIPIIFQYLRKNLQSQQNLSNEYSNLSDTIQKVVSTCSQYIHDRHDHENELLFLKDKISQILGQIGYTQLYLEQYWRMIYSLEHETKRLQVLLRNPQILQINQEKFQTLQESQKIKLDRFIKENEKMKILINKQKDSIKTTQIQIERDIKELQTLKPILNKIKLEEKDLQHHWSQIGLFPKNYH
jgi:AraC-like DNA-binding protein